MKQVLCVQTDADAARAVRVDTVEEPRCPDDGVIVAVPTGLFFVVCELQSALALRGAWPQLTQSSWSLHRAAASLPSTYVPTRAPLWRRLQWPLAVCTHPVRRTHRF